MVLRLTVTRLGLILFQIDFMGQIRIRQFVSYFFQLNYVKYHNNVNDILSCQTILYTELNTFLKRKMRKVYTPPIPFNLSSF